MNHHIIVILMDHTIADIFRKLLYKARRGLAPTTCVSGNGIRLRILEHEVIYNFSSSPSSYTHHKYDHVHDAVIVPPVVGINILNKFIARNNL